MPKHNNTPTKYQSAQIYKITNSDTDDCYIGSTNYKHLSKRYWRHRRDGYNPTYAHRYGDLFKTDNHKIECLEKFPCANKEALRVRERFWIDQHPHAINKMRPILTQEEKLKNNRAGQARWYATDRGKMKKAISNKRFRDNNPNYAKQQCQARKLGLSMPAYRLLCEEQEKKQNKDIIINAPDGCNGVNISVKFD